MASASGPQDWDRAGVAALGSHWQLRLGICFWFRLFNVVPETTARFIRLEHRSRSQSPPCQCASDRSRPPILSAGWALLIRTDSGRPAAVPATVGAGGTGHG